MIKGIFIFEHGGLQQIGDLNSLAGIIVTMEQMLPQLKKQEAERVLDSLSKEELEAAIKSKSANTGKTSKLEP